jgi:hypothetical protein
MQSVKIFTYVFIFKWYKKDLASQNFIIGFIVKMLKPSNPLGIYSHKDCNKI